MNDRTIIALTGICFISQEAEENLASWTNGIINLEESANRNMVDENEIPKFANFGKVLVLLAITRSTTLLLLHDTSTRFLPTTE